jgi:uncharacterized membrane protein
MSWFGQAAALFVAAIELVFGAIEIFRPRRAAELVFAKNYVEPSNPIWLEPGRNLGFYNWFLGFGLILAVLYPSSGAHMIQFLVACVAVAGIVGWATVGFSIAFIIQLGIGVAALLLSFF